jgi:nicotinamide-nucleotide amidase
VTSTLSKSLTERATAILDLYRVQNLMIATAESCTGGLIAASLTEIAGSSDVVDRGFVTYSNEAKNDAIGVDMSLIETHGAVSAEVATAMAAGALAHSRADAAVAVTGIAGPGGGTAEKPVGLVFIGGARLGQTPLVERHVFDGDRSQVRQDTVLRAFDVLEQLTKLQRTG